MISNINSNYKSICKYFNFAKKSIDVNKKLLLELAKSGANRPSQKTKLGKRLSDYTKKTSSTFDANFNFEIRRIRLDWFLSQSQIVKKKKKKLLQMAKNEEKRPSYDKTKIGKDLSNYTRKSSLVYDPEFDKTIRKLRPDWFRWVKND